MASICLMCVARNVPKAPERCFTRVSSGLTRKQKTRLERPAGIEIGLEQALFVFLNYFFPHLNM
jgi:hypothetical protein